MDKQIVKLIVPGSTTSFPLFEYFGSNCFRPYLLARNTRNSGNNSSYTFLWYDMDSIENEASKYPLLPLEHMNGVVT
jgi:hypothetical protein